MSYKHSPLLTRLSACRKGESAGRTGEARRWRPSAQRRAASGGAPEAGRRRVGPGLVRSATSDTRALGGAGWELFFGPCARSRGRCNGRAGSAGCPAGSYAVTPLPRTPSLIGQAGLWTMPCGHRGHNLMDSAGQHAVQALSTRLRPLRPRGRRGAAVASPALSSSLRDRKAGERPGGRPLTLRSGCSGGSRMRSHDRPAPPGALIPDYGSCTTLT
jgi:hypothetical protein